MTKKWLKRWHEKQERIKRGLRSTYIYHVIGDRIFDRHIWKIDIKSLSGGLSLGLFVAFTPTIPFQMLLSAAGAILLRVNLPVALVVCWVTNPLTAFPIYLSAYRLGKCLFEGSRLFEFVIVFFDIETRTGRFVEQGFYLWTGSLVFSIVSASLGYIALHFAWGLKRWIKDKITDDG